MLSYQKVKGRARKRHEAGHGEGQQQGAVPPFEMAMALSGPAAKKNTHLYAEGRICSGLFCL